MSMRPMHTDIKDDNAHLFNMLLELGGVSRQMLNMALANEEDETVIELYDSVTQGLQAIILQFHVNESKLDLGKDRRVYLKVPETWTTMTDDEKAKWSVEALDKIWP